MPALDFGQDGLGLGGPDERLGRLVVLGEVTVDRGLEVDQRMEYAAFRAVPGELGEEALDRITSSIWRLRARSATGAAPTWRYGVWRSCMRRAVIGRRCCGAAVRAGVADAAAADGGPPHGRRRAMAPRAGCRSVCG